MLIAGMTESPGKKGRIAASFSIAEYLLIFDTESGELAASYPRAAMSDSELAEKIVGHDCEAVICGPIEEGPFAIIADEGCVTRYHGVGLELEEAVAKMDAYQLELITDFIGGSGCGSGEGQGCDGRHAESS